LVSPLNLITGVDRLFGKGVAHIALGGQTNGVGVVQAVPAAHGVIVGIKINVGVGGVQPQAGQAVIVGVGVRVGRGPHVL